MLIRLIRKFRDGRRKAEKEKKQGFSKSEVEERLKNLNFEIDDASIIQEKLEADRERLREKIEKLKSEGKSATSLAPLIVKYKNYGKQTNLNSEKMVKLYEIQGALNLMILSETSYTPEQVDRISDLFDQADTTLSMFLIATEDLAKNVESSEMGSTNDKNKYLDDFDNLVEEEKRSAKKKLNLDEL